MALKMKNGTTRKLRPSAYGKTVWTDLAQQSQNMADLSYQELVTLANESLQDINDKYMASGGLRKVPSPPPMHPSKRRGSMGTITRPLPRPPDTTFSIPSDFGDDVERVPSYWELLKDFIPALFGRKKKTIQRIENLLESKAPENRYEVTNGYGQEGRR